MALGILEPGMSRAHDSHHFSLVILQRTSRRNRRQGRIKADRVVSPASEHNHRRHRIFLVVVVEVNVSALSPIFAAPDDDTFKARRDPSERRPTPSPRSGSIRPANRRAQQTITEQHGNCRRTVDRLKGQRPDSIGMR